MNERDDQWSPADSRQPESPPRQRREQRASTNIQQTGMGGSMESQGPAQPSKSGGMQSPPQTGGEGMGQPSQQQGQQQTAPGRPMVDIVETPEDIVVYVDVPGYEKDDIDIHADANTLAVSADRSSETPFDEDEGEHGLVMERPMRLERTVSLPVHIDPEEASASYEDGVAEITVPKEEEEKRREIGFQ